MSSSPISSAHACSSTSSMRPPTTSRSVTGRSGESSPATARASMRCPRCSCSTRSISSSASPAFAPDAVERVFALSCATGEGVEEFRRTLFSLVPPAPQIVADRARARRLSRLPPEAAPSRVPHPAHGPRLSRRRHAAEPRGARGGVTRRRRACRGRGRGRGRGARVPVTTGILGGAFDPPHNGHVALLAAAERHFAFDEVLVLVVADPGHRSVVAPARDASCPRKARVSRAPTSSSTTMRGPSICSATGASTIRCS